MDHSGKDGDDVVKDLEYDQKNESSGGTLKDAARAGVMARLAELAGLPAQEIEEALGDSPEDTASRIMSEVSLDEEDTNEGNEFSGALEDAKKRRQRQNLKLMVRNTKLKQSTVMKTLFKSLILIRLQTLEKSILRLQK